MGRAQNLPAGFPLSTNINAPTKVTGKGENPDAKACVTPSLACHRATGLTQLALSWPGSVGQATKEPHAGAVGSRVGKVPSSHLFEILLPDPASAVMSERGFSPTHLSGHPRSRHTVVMVRNCLFRKYFFKNNSQPAVWQKPSRGFPKSTSQWLLFGLVPCTVGPRRCSADTWVRILALQARCGAWPHGASVSPCDVGKPPTPHVTLDKRWLFPLYHCHRHHRSNTGNGILAPSEAPLAHKGKIGPSMYF